VCFLKSRCRSKGGGAIGEVCQVEFLSAKVVRGKGVKKANGTRTTPPQQKHSLNLVPIPSNPKEGGFYRRGNKKDEGEKRKRGTH